MIKYIKYPLEFCIFIIFFFFFFVLPLNISRKLGVFLALRLGQMTNANKIINKNLKIAFPNKSNEWIAQTNKGVWTNFGKVLAEYAQLNKIAKNNIIKIIENNYSKSFFERSENKILISAHNANWEIPGIACRIKSNKISGIVREPNNPFIRFILSYLRNKYSVRCYEKNIIGTKKLMRDFKNGFSIALLADQKLSSGIEIKFFGKNVYATALPAQLALKSKSDIYLAWPKRQGNNFEFKFCELIESSKLQDNEENKIKKKKKINSFFEKKILENPSEYFWHHNRWG